MRIVSLITAVAVVSILYILVFERDVLNGFSDGKNIQELANDLGDGPELNSEENLVGPKTETDRKLISVVSLKVEQKQLIAP